MELEYQQKVIDLDDPRKLSTFIYNKKAVGGEISKGSYGEVRDYPYERDKKSVVKIFTRKNSELDFLREVYNNVTVYRDNDNNQYIVPVIAVDSSKKVFVMPKGDSNLNDYLKNKKLDLTDKIILMYTLALGLNDVHNLGVVHYDIKPQNIIMFGDTPKYSDFGISQTALCGISYTDNSYKFTLWYSNPIVLDVNNPYKDSIMFSGDLFSLGIVFYHIMTGNISPFPLKNTKKEQYEEMLNYVAPQSDYFTTVTTDKKGKQTVIPSPGKKYKGLTAIDCGDDRINDIIRYMLNIYDHKITGKSSKNNIKDVIYMFQDIFQGRIEYEFPNITDYNCGKNSLRTLCYPKYIASELSTKFRSEMLNSIGNIYNSYGDGSKYDNYPFTAFFCMDYCNCYFTEGRVDGDLCRRAACFILSIDSEDLGMKPLSDAETVEILDMFKKSNYNFTANNPYYVFKKLFKGLFKDPRNYRDYYYEVYYHLILLFYVCGLIHTYDIFDIYNCGIYLLEQMTAYDPEKKEINPFGIKTVKVEEKPKFPYYKFDEATNSLLLKDLRRLYDKESNNYPSYLVENVKEVMEKLPASKMDKIKDVLHQIIPSNRFMTKEEIYDNFSPKLLTSGSDENINRKMNNYQTLLKYIEKDLAPYDVSYCFQKLDKISLEVLNRTLDNTLILAPGDSPFRVVNHLKLVYQVEENYYKYVYEEKQETKNIVYLAFPLSGLGGSKLAKPEVIQGIADYLEEIFTVNNVDILYYFNNNSIGFMDAIAAGGTGKNLLAALTLLYVELTGNPESKIKWIQEINLRPYYKEDEDDCGDYNKYLFSRAEDAGARCVNSYKIKEGVKEDVSLFYKNTFNCNIVSVLSYINSSAYKELQLQFKSYVEITYLDGDNLVTVTGFLRISILDSSNVLIFYFEDFSDRYKSLKWLLVSKVIEQRSIKNIDIIQTLDDREYKAEEIYKYFPNENACECKFSNGMTGHVIQKNFEDFPHLIGFVDELKPVLMNGFYEAVEEYSDFADDYGNVEYDEDTSGIRGSVKGEDVYLNCYVEITDIDDLCTGEGKQRGVLAKNSKYGYIFRKIDGKYGMISYAVTVVTNNMIECKILDHTKNITHYLSPFEFKLLKSKINDNSILEIDTYIGNMLIPGYSFADYSLLIKKIKIFDYDYSKNYFKYLRFFNDNKGCEVRINCRLLTVVNSKIIDEGNFEGVCYVYLGNAIIRYNKNPSYHFCIIKQEKYILEKNESIEENINYMLSGIRSIELIEKSTEMYDILGSTKYNPLSGIIKTEHLDESTGVWKSVENKDKWYLDGNYIVGKNTGKKIIKLARYYE